MATKRILLTVAVFLVVIAAQPAERLLWAQSRNADALAGQVSSAEEGPMEGVLVTAKKADSTIAVTVVTDQNGHYSFPRSRLVPGQYAVRIRAVGYDLEGPDAVQVTSESAAKADLKLRKATDLVSQLTNSEFLMSFPGTQEQKASIQRCTHCHTLERIVRSNHDAEEFEQVIARMARHTPESFPLLIQPTPPGSGRIGGGELTPEWQARQQQTRQKQAEYLSSLNLSSTPQWEYSFKTLPRPKGRATRVVITEYDLPKRTRQPHDVIVDSEGMAWYASFGEPILGKLDPRTGKVSEYAVPVLKPNHVKGTLDIEFDKDQNVWLAMTFQAAVAKFDRKTEKFQVFRLPPGMDGNYREFTFVDPSHSYVDGKVWISDVGTQTILRLDLATGKFEVFEPYPVPRPNNYELTSDAQNNAYFAIITRSQIGRIDAKTGKITFYTVPTSRSGPRRGMIDAQRRFWFGENGANQVGMFNTKTETFREWASPTPYYFPYDVAVDKNGEAWASTEFADRVERLNPKTGQFTEYLLPRETNMRRSFVDNATTPVTFWVGNTHGGSIVRLEPLD